MNGAGRLAAKEPLSVRLLTDPPGVVEAPARPTVAIVIHVGPSVYIACDRGGKSHLGLSVHGDVDIVPAGVASRWEMKETDTALLVSVPESLLNTVAEESGADSSRLAIINRFQIRDRQIEQIGWVLKTELESGYPNGGLYLDSLGTALAVHLINHHSSEARESREIRGGLAGRRLKAVLSYIEDNLAHDLSVRQIAEVAGLSVSHCKTAFRQATGQPVHQYVIQRRVERARTLLGEGGRPISQIALEAGFSHQSHLAYHMRRVLGVSPRAIAGGQ